MHQQLIKFAIVGFLSVAVNFLVYSMVFATSSLIIPSAILGYFAGLVNSYALNKFWVFSSTSAPHPKEIFRFLLVYAVGALGMLSLIYLFYFIFGFDYRMSWLVGAIYAVLNNYYGNKFIVFNQGRIR